MEEEIRDLCTRLVATTETEDFEAVANELRNALHAHVEQLRLKVHQIALANQLLLALESAEDPMKESSA